MTQRGGAFEDEIERELQRLDRGGETAVDPLAAEVEAMLASPAMSPDPSALVSTEPPPAEVDQALGFQLPDDRSPDPSELVSTEPLPPLVTEPAPAPRTGVTTVTPVRGSPEERALARVPMTPAEDLELQGRAIAVADARRRAQGQLIHTPGRPDQTLPTTSAETVRQGPQIDPETLERIQAGFQSEAGNTLVSGEALAAARENQAAEFARQAEEARGELARLREEQNERQAVVDGQMAHIRERADQIQKRQIDPERVFSSEGAAIGAILLGTLGQVFGDEGRTFDRIQERIQRDIDLQKSERDFEVGLLGEERNTLESLEQQMLSPQAAEAATRALMYQSAAAMTEAEAARLGGAQAKAQANVIASELMRKAAEAQAEAEIRTADEVVRNQNFQFLPGQKGGVHRVGGTATDRRKAAEDLKALGVVESVPQGMALIETDPLRARQFLAAGALEGDAAANPFGEDAKLFDVFKDARGRAVRVDGRTFFAGDTQAARELSDEIEIIDSIRENYERLLQLNEEGPDFESQGEAFGLGSVNESLLAAALEKGVLGDAEAERLQPITGISAADVFEIDSATAAKIRGTIAGLEVKRRQRLGRLTENPRLETLLQQTGESFRQGATSEAIGSLGKAPGSR